MGNNSDVRAAHKKRRLVPFLCRLTGTLIFLAVIAVYLPLTVPRLMGYQIYEVISGSMEPALPVGSVAYVEQTAAEELPEGTIVAFLNDGGDTVIHRVAENHVVEGELITKGDANEQNDLSPVPYSSVLGRVAYSLPLLGRVAEPITTMIGKIYMFGFLLAAILFHLLAGRIQSRDE